MSKAVLFYEKEIDVLLSIPEKQRGRVLTAIFLNSKGKELPELDPMEAAVYTLINAQVKRAEELSNKRRESANSRWNNGAESVQNNAKVMQNDANSCTNTNTNTNTLLTSVSNNATSASAACAEKSKPEKVKFAEFVSMTNEEYNSLVTELGEQGAKRCIDILDNFKGAKGKEYASDYRAIRSWVIKRYKEEKCETHNQPQSAAETTNADKVDRKTLEKKYGDVAVSKYEAKFDNWSAKQGTVRVEKYSEIAKWMANDNIPEVPKSRSSFDVDEVMNKIYAKYREDEKHDN